MTQPSDWIAGADGFKSKWFVVLKNRTTKRMLRRIVPSFAGLLCLPENPSVVTVDIPIGLPQFASPGGRACERLSRKVLGPRASSVFSAVGRVPLLQPNRLEADRASRLGGGLGVGAQAWGLAKKLLEADEAMTVEAQHVVHEVHPEVSFWAMHGGRPMPFGKKCREGIRARQDVLLRAGFPPEFVEALAADLRVPADDFLDACAAVWTAERIAHGLGKRFPDEIDLDMRGLDQAIWF